MASSQQSTTTTTTTPSPSPSPSSPTTQKVSSIELNTPESLSQIRSLTDVGTITRLLHECIAYQRTLDSDLSNLLSQRTTLDSHLSSLLHSSTILSVVKSDASDILSSVFTTSLLADSASSKVRELDLAQSRVSDTLLRLDAVSEKSACIDSVRAGLESDDYEGAACSVKRFFEIDDKFRDSVGSNQRDEMVEFKKRLECVVKKRFNVGVDHRDHSTVVRFIQLYPLLGIEEEGLQV